MAEGAFEPAGTGAGTDIKRDTGKPLLRHPHKYL